MEPDLTLAPFFIWSWRGAWCGDPDGGIGGARHHYGRMGGHLWGTGTASHQIGIDRARPRGLCINQNIRTPSLTPISCGVTLCVTYVQNSNQ